jgi:hypothetical protein
MTKNSVRFVVKKAERLPGKGKGKGKGKGGCTFIVDEHPVWLCALPNAQNAQKCKMLW